MFLIKKKEDIKNLNKTSSLNRESYLYYYSNSDNIYFLKWLDTNKNNVIPYQRKNNNYNYKNGIKSLKNNIFVTNSDINEGK